MASISITKSGNTLLISATGLSRSKMYKYDLNIIDDYGASYMHAVSKYYSNVTSFTASESIPKLPEYRCTAEIYLYDGVGDLCDNDSVTVSGSGGGGTPDPDPDPDPDPGPGNIDPTFSYNVTSNVITVYCTNAGSYYYVNYELFLTEDDSRIEYSTTLHQLNAEDRAEHVFNTNIKANTCYYVIAHCSELWGSDTTDVEISPIVTDSLTIEPWTWFDKNGTVASKTQVTYSYSAIVNKSQTNNFYADVWDEMVYKTIDVLHLCGTFWQYGNYIWLPDNTRFQILTAGNTRMESDKVLTAARFNSLGYNIKYCLTKQGLSNGTDTFPVVTKGYIVYGGYILNMMSELNRAIGEINSK